MFTHALKYFSTVSGIRCFLSLPDTGDVRLSLNGKTYQNNSLVALKDIGEVNNSLLCLTGNTACCSRAQVPGRGILGDWFYPNGTRVPNTIIGLTRLYYGQPIIWEFYRNRGPSVVRLHRRRGGVTGIYRCVIPDTAGVDQTLYIGVYTASTGKPLVSHLAYYILTCVCESYNKEVSWYVDIYSCSVNQDPIPVA